MGRKWIKLYVEEWESGSVRVDMDSAERGFWVDMLARASHTRKEGLICRDANGLIGFTNKELADDYHVPVDLVERTIAKRLKDKSIVIHENNVIEIVNYWKYQSKLSKDGEKTNTEESNKVTWDKEHKEARNKAMAYKSGFNHPEDAKAGIEARSFEDSIKSKIKNSRVASAKIDTSTD